jgi:hypothetical protein
MSEAGEGPPHVGFAPGLTIGRVLPLYSRSAAFALPGPMPQGVSYVQISVVYIRTTIPAGAPLPRRRSWADWTGAMDAIPRKELLP